MNESDQFISIGIAAAVTLIFLGMAAFFILGISGIGHTEPKACEDVGGEYVVIGEDFSPALKRTIDLYGCVKK